MNFDKLCESKNRLPGNLNLSNRFFKNWRDYSLFITLCIDNSKLSKSIANPIIATYFSEIQETLDGLYLLSKKFSVTNMLPLVRKLFEMYVQCAYILQDDTNNKAIVFEAKVIKDCYDVQKSNDLIKLKDLNSDDKAQIECYYNKMIENNLNNLKKFTDNQWHNKIMVNINANHYWSWYKLYNYILLEKEIKPRNYKFTLKDLCKIIDISIISSDKDAILKIYEKIYGALSQEIHGVAVRKKLVVFNKCTVLNSFRYPEQITFLMKTVNTCLWHLHLELIHFYNINIPKSKQNFNDFIRSQCKLIAKVDKAENLFIKNKKI